MQNGQCLTKQLEMFILYEEQGKKSFLFASWLGEKDCPDVLRDIACGISSDEGGHSLKD